MVNLKNQTVWIKNFAYWKVFGKRLNVIRSSNLEKHGNTDISVKCPYSERSLPLKTGVGLKYPREKISDPREKTLNLRRHSGTRPTRLTMARDPRN